MRNTKIAYILIVLNSSWFWLGTWVLYYLRFTNYSGIGLIETLMIATFTIFEIPTGAVADLLGKKVTLTLAFVLGAIGNLLMGYAPSLSVLLLSVPILTLGGSLYSGTLEALLYDSLKEEGKEKIYDKVIANRTTLQLATFAVTSILGGIMYKISPGMPFWALGYLYIVAVFISLFLTEPSIDTEKFSWKNYKKQTIQGFKQLFKKRSVAIQSIMLILVGFFITIGDQMFNDIQTVSFGYTPEQLGILAAVFYSVSAGASQISPKITKLFKGNMFIIFTGLVFGITFVFAPLLGVTIGTTLIGVRWATQAIFSNYTSEAVNRNTDSKYRATTISTLNMIVSIPYVILAIYIGGLIDKSSPQKFSLVMGFVLLVISVLLPLVFRSSKKENTV